MYQLNMDYTSCSVLWFDYPSKTRALLEAMKIGIEIKINFQTLNITKTLCDKWKKGKEV